MRQTTRIFVGRGLSHDIAIAEAARLQPLKYRSYDRCIGS
jgi:hypothetical protein